MIWQILFSSVLYGRINILNHELSEIRLEPTKWSRPKRIETQFIIIYGARIKNYFWIKVVFFFPIRIFTLGNISFCIGRTKRTIINTVHLYLKVLFEKCSTTTCQKMKQKSIHYWWTRSSSRLQKYLMQWRYILIKYIWAETGVHSLDLEFCIFLVWPTSCVE